MKQQLIGAMNDPHQLELLYQENPNGFIAAFHEIYEDHKDSSIIQCWFERLSFIPETKEKKGKWTEKTWLTTLLTILFVMAGGWISKISLWLPDRTSYDEMPDLFHIRNAGFYFLPFIAVLYLLHTRARLKTILLASAFILIGVIYINLLPNYVFKGKIGSYSDTLLLACFHLPFLYWFAGAIGYIGHSFLPLQKRIEFLKMNSEILFMTALILIAGALLTGISLASFNIIGIEAEFFYLNWVVVFGLIGSPIVATALVLKVIKIQNLPPLLAKIFAPLFLVTILVFLSLILLKIKNPFEDRNFLIVINILLFIVMSLTTFVLLDRKSHTPRNVMDYIVIILLVSCFLIDTVTIISVISRLIKEGLTPNRIALMGINLVLMVNLAGLLLYFSGWLIKKVEYNKTVEWIARFLPVYVTWSAFMVFIFPWLFGLR